MYKMLVEMANIYIPVDVPDQGVNVKVSTVSGNSHIILTDIMSDEVIHRISYKICLQIEEVAEEYVDKLDDIEDLRIYLEETNRAYIDDLHELEDVSIKGIIMEGRFLITEYVFGH